jgi:thiamine phosphate synthase YjbQ (UPF0047 family)
MDLEVGNLLPTKTSDSTHISRYMYSCYTAPTTDSLTNSTSSDNSDIQKCFNKILPKNVHLVHNAPKINTNDEIVATYFGHSMIFF